MWQCHYCRTPLSLEVQRKNRLCPNCASDLHCCKNCIYYNESLTSKCRESNSPWIADRDAQNNCTYFEFAHVSQSAPTSSDVNTEAEKAKEAFRNLFRNL